jgi:hypothetical protein
MRPAHLAIAATLAAVMAMACVAVVASAFAPPEFGRCIKNAKHEGGSGYSNSRCTTHVEEGAKYHWVSGPGSKRGFTASGGGVALYVSSGIYHVKASPKVECSSASTLGEYTSANTESLELTLTGCKMASASCQSEAAPAGEIVFTPLEGLLVVSKHEYWGEALIRWSPAIGETLASFECGGTSVVVSDSILHEIKRNKMLSSEAADLKIRKEGAQVPSCYETSVDSCEGEYPLISIGGAPGELAGLSISGTQTDEEVLEANTLLP